MEEQSSFTSVLREDTFEVVVRGYNKRQVHDYMLRTRRQVKDLEEKLRRANETVDTAKVELDEARKAAAVKPAHEEVSDRLSRILQLADEEADQRRAAASEDIARMRELAEQDAQRVVDDARAQAERIVSEAKSESDRDLAGAREEAQRLLETSTAEAERTLTDAQNRAKSLLDQTERRANAINEVLSKRLMALTSTHAEAVRRLTDMRDTMTTLLSEDASGGPLAAAVEAAMGQPLEPAEYAPAPGAVAAAAGAAAPAVASAEQQADGDSQAGEQAQVAQVAEGADEVIDLTSLEQAPVVAAPAPAQVTGPARR